MLADQDLHRVLNRVQEQEPAIEHLGAAGVQAPDTPDRVALTGVVLNRILINPAHHRQDVDRRQDLLLLGLLDLRSLRLPDPLGPGFPDLLDPGFPDLIGPGLPAIAGPAPTIQDFRLGQNFLNQGISLGWNFLARNITQDLRISRNFLVWSTIQGSGIKQGLSLIQDFLAWSIIQDLRLGQNFLDRSIIQDFRISQNFLVWSTIQGSGIKQGLSLIQELPGPGASSRTSASARTSWTGASSKTSESARTSWSGVPSRASAWAGTSRSGVPSRASAWAGTSRPRSAVQGISLGWNLPAALRTLQLPARLGRIFRLLAPGLPGTKERHQYLLTTSLRTSSKNAKESPITWCARRKGNSTTFRESCRNWGISPG